MTNHDNIKLHIAMMFIELFRPWQGQTVTTELACDIADAAVQFTTDLRDVANSLGQSEAEAEVMSAEDEAEAREAIYRANQYRQAREPTDAEEYADDDALLAEFDTALHVSDDDIMDAVRKSNG